MTAMSSVVFSLSPVNEMESVMGRMKSIYESILKAQQDFSSAQANLDRAQQTALANKSIKPFC